MRQRELQLWRCPRCGKVYRRWVWWCRHLLRVPCDSLRCAGGPTPAGSDDALEIQTAATVTTIDTILWGGARMAPYLILGYTIVALATVAVILCGWGF